MKHRIYHSNNLRERLPEYALKLEVDMPSLNIAYDWMVQNDVIFEEGDAQAIKVSISSVNIETRIEQANARKFYAFLRDEIPARFVPLYGVNWITFGDRLRKVWEQIYNILINKIPSHHIRLFWLKVGGAKIGKGSTIWRNTEILGMENLVMGNDSCIAWHCQIDARAGLLIGDHVAIASYAKIIAGSHDLTAPEFWSVSAPIYIEDYVWVATGALIAHGAKLGYGSVVTANTLVAKEVQPYKIVGGSGAKAMGERPHNLTYKVGGKGLFSLLH